MMMRAPSALVLAGTLSLGACAVAPPTGPSVMALPGKGKSFAQFQQDDMACRQYASAQIGYGSPTQAANDSAVSSAVAGTVIGAAAGAVLGAAAGNPAAGAAIGAGSGLFVGGASGADAAAFSAGSLQQRYDMGYVQCMYSKGDSVSTTTADSAAPYYGAGYGYSNPYPYPYSYPYPYTYGPYGYYRPYPGYYYPYAPYYAGPPVSVGLGFGFGHYGWGR